MTFLLVWLLSLVEYAAGSVMPLPLGPLITLAVLALALRRAAAAAPGPRPVGTNTVVGAGVLRLSRASRL